MSDVMFTRWGGNIAIFPDEVSAANATSIEYYLMKYLVELGNTIHIFGNVSVKSRKRMLTNEREKWTNNIIVHDEPIVEVPSYITHVFCAQGSENLRFGGLRGIPSQHWIYRLIRNCRVPFIYMQWDAYTPIFLPAETRGEPLVTWGCSVKDICSCPIFILPGGRNKEPFIKYNYEGVLKDWQVYMMDHDAHQVAIPTLDEFSLEPKSKEDVIPGIAFVGKNRNQGSRGSQFKELAKALHESDLEPEFKINLFGDWKGFEEEGNPIFSRFSFHGKIAGTSTVVGKYNDYEFAILLGNERNLEFGLNTIRTYEVLTGGTLPIIEKRWFDTWGNIFGDSLGAVVRKYLTYEEIKDIPELVKTLRKSDVYENRKSFILKLRKALREILNDEFVRSNVKNLLEYTTKQSKNPEYFSEEKIKERTLAILVHMYNKEATSKRATIKDAALNNLKRRKSLNFGDNYKELSNQKEEMRKHYIFEEATFSDEELFEMFRR